MDESFGIALLGIWLLLGLWGTIILWRKRYLGFFRVVASLGCLGWIIYGWAVALVIVVLPLELLIGAGGFTLLVAKILPTKVPSNYTYTGQSSSEA